MIGQEGDNPTREIPAVHRLPEDQRLWCRVCGHRKRLVHGWDAERHIYVGVRYVCDDPHVPPDPVETLELSPLPEPQLEPTDTYAAWKSMVDDRERQFLEQADQGPVGNQRP